MNDIELAQRLERLERDNRRFKRLGIVAAVIAAALGFMAATRPVPQKITAHEFDVVDSTGRVRIRMSALHGIGVNVLDAQGVSQVGMTYNKVFGPSILLGSRPAQGGGYYSDVRIGESLLAGPSIMLGSNAPEGASVDLGVSAAGQPNIELTDSNGINRASVFVSSEGEPAIGLSDPEGFSMDLGSAKTQNLATGASQQTSADSIIMFGNGKKHYVIWRAPSVLPRLPSATLPAVPPSTSPTPPVPSSSQSASILANHASGAYLKLDDGTAYIVDAVDRVTSALWLVGDDVVVDSNSQSCTDTRLINVDENGDSVCAKPVQ